MVAAVRLKRMMSRNMRQNFQFRRLPRWANTVFRLEPLYTRAPRMPVPGSLTENDMSDGALATPRSANSWIRWG